MADGDHTKRIITLGPHRRHQQTQQDRLYQACETHCQDESPCNDYGEAHRLW
jgi:hypothetical protein